MGEEAEENPATKKQKKDRAIRALPLDQQGLGRLVMSLSGKLNREVIKIRKEADRRHENLVEKNIFFGKVIGEVRSHDAKQDSRLDDLEAEVKKLKGQVSSGSRTEQALAGVTLGEDGGAHRRRLRERHSV